LLIEQLDYNLLFRWFVKLGIDDPVWPPTAFTTNRDRLLEGEVAAKFLAAVLGHARLQQLLSREHFSVDGTLIEAWASIKSFRPMDGGDEPPTGGRNGSRDFHGERRRDDTRAGTGSRWAPSEPTTGWVVGLRALNATPHVAPNLSGRTSRIDRRTVRHRGSLASQRARQRIEEAFAWIKTVAGQAKTSFRGTARVGWAFTLAAAAYSLIRLPKLLRALP
jgi:hypothetical protein